MLPALALLAAASPAFVDVDATFFAGRLPAVKAEVAPGKSTYFMLDTGSTTTLCFAKIADGRFGPILKLGSRSVTVSSKPDDEVKERFDGMTSPIPDAKIEGLFGTDFLRDKQALLDPYHGRIALRTGAALDPKEAERLLREADPFQAGRLLATLPLALLENGWYAARLRIAGKEARVALDTGSPFFALRKTLSEGAGAVEIAENGAGPGTPGVRMLPELAVHSSRLPLQVVADCPFEEIDGVLGLTHLARTAIVDLPGKAVYYLRPDKPADIVDAALARIVGLPVVRMKDGMLALDLGAYNGVLPSTGEPMVLVSVQARPIDSLRSLVERAIGGEAKAIAEIAKVCRARWKSPTCVVHQEGKDTTLTFGIL